MTPRARRRWLVAILVLLLPILLLSAVLWYFGSGKAIRDLQQRWAEHLPGELLLEQVQLEGVGTIGAAGLGWRDNGQNHVTIEKVTIGGNPLAGEVRSIHLNQPVIKLNRQGRSSWEALGLAMQQLMAADTTDKTYPTPAITITDGVLQIENERLDDVQFTTSNHGDGRMEVLFLARQGDKPWRIEASLAQDMTMTVTKLDIDLHARQLVTALFALLPFESEVTAFIADLPDELHISAQQFTVTPEGEFDTNFHVVFPNNWRSIETIDLNLGHQAGALNGAMSIDHPGGATSIELKPQQNDYQVHVHGAPLPIAALIGMHWPLSTIPAPAQVDMDGSALNIDTTGTISGALRMVFPEQWAGLSQINIDQISLENVFSDPQLIQSKMHKARFIFNSGHEYPLQVLASLEEVRPPQSGHETERIISVQGTETLTSTATLLQLMRQMVEIPEIPAIAQLMIPQQLSFKGLSLSSNLSYVDGTFAMGWANGHLRSDVVAYLPETSGTFTNLSFQHPLIGKLSGKAELTADNLHTSWDQLSLAPSLLSTLSIYLGLPSTSPQAITELLHITPRGKADWTLQDAGYQARIKLHDETETIFSEASIEDKLITLEAKGLPLTLVSTLYPSVTLEGEIISSTARLERSADNVIPKSLTLSTTPVSGSSGGWAGSSSGVSLSVTFGTDDQGQLVPEQAEIDLSKLSGSHRGVIARIPGLNLKTSRRAPNKWFNEVRIHDVPGFLSADLKVPNWLKTLPENGELVANAFDVATALRSILLRGEDGTLRSLAIPQDLVAQLDGKLFIKETEVGYDLSLEGGQLSKTTWLPWVQQANMTLDGTSSFDGNSFRTKLSGAIQGGQFNILGHLTDIQTDDLIYGVSLEQNADGLKLEDLFFAVKDPGTGDDESVTSKRQPLIHLSGHTDGNGAATLQAILDEIDIGWVTTLPDVGIPQKIQLTGRARSVLDLTFDGEEVLTSEGMLYPIGIDVDVSGGRVQIKNMSGVGKILPRSWLLRNGTIEPLISNDEQQKEATK